MSDDLISRLSADLTPVRPMRMGVLVVGAGLGLLVWTLLVLAVLPARPEIAALGHGVWPGVFVVIGKPLLFLLIGLNALWVMTGLHRPEARPEPMRLVPVFVLILIVMITLMVEISQQGLAEVVTRLGDPVLNCFLTIALGGIVGFGLVYVLWLKRSATAHPAMLGGFAALMCAALSAAVYALHCDRDAPVYILSYYGSAVSVMGGLGALAGRWILRW